MLMIAVGVTILLIPISANAMKYYVKPYSSPNSDCPPDKACYTLNEYAYNHTDLFYLHPDNATLVFLDGAHILIYNLSITHIQNVTITAANNTGDSINVRLYVLKRISLVNVSYVDFENIAINGAKFALSPNIEIINAKSFLQYHFVVRDCHIILHASNVALVKSNYTKSLSGILGTNVTRVYNCS